MNRALTAAVIGLFLVFATAGSATINIETVPVGNPGNAGKLSGVGAGGYNPDRICGAVGYSYNIGKYEVTAGQYTEFLNAVAKTDTYGLYNTQVSSWGGGSQITQTDANGDGLWEYSVASDYANRPVNYVSWGDAARFANWLHNGQPTGAQDASTTEDGSYTLNGATTAAHILAVTRKPNATWVIPTEDEWYKAAYHKNDGVTGNYFDYPTGTDTVPGRDMADVSGNNANYWTDSGPYPIDIDSGRYYTTVVGEFQNSDSPYGTFDQGGNVAEWNETWIDSGRDSFGSLRGGAFPGTVTLLQASVRDFDSPTAEAVKYGFRVARVPEPASMAILVLGGLGMLVRRRGVRA